MDLQFQINDAASSNFHKKPGCPTKHVVNDFGKLHFNFPLSVGGEYTGEEI